MESPATKLLLVVDMQRDFISGPLGSPEAREIVPNVCDRIRAFDGDILFTLDTHMENYLETQEGRRLPVRHCIAGSDGWSPDPAVWMALMDQNVADEYHTVFKNAFGSPDLPLRIHEKYGESLEEITLIGLCTDICVITQALLLKAFFPETRLVVDASCCAGVTPESHHTALAAMRACQIDIENE